MLTDRNRRKSRAMAQSRQSLVIVAVYPVYTSPTSIGLATRLIQMG